MSKYSLTWLSVIAEKFSLFRPTRWYLDRDNALRFLNAMNRHMGTDFPPETTIDTSFDVWTDMLLSAEQRDGAAE